MKTMDDYVKMWEDAGGTVPTTKAVSPVSSNTKNTEEAEPYVKTMDDYVKMWGNAGGEVPEVKEEKEVKKPTYPHISISDMVKNPLQQSKRDTSGIPGGIDRSKDMRVKDQVYDSTFRYSGKPEQEQEQGTEQEFPMLNATQLKQLTPEQTKQYQDALKKYITAISPEISNFKEEEKKEEPDKGTGPITTPEAIRQSEYEPVKILNKEQIDQLPEKDLMVYQNKVKRDVQDNLAMSKIAQRQGEDMEQIVSDWTPLIRNIYPTG